MNYGKQFLAETILALIGGAVILIVGIATFAVAPLSSGGWGMMGNWGMMGSGWNMMSGLGMTWINMGIYGIVGIVSGLLVIIAAFMLGNRPAEHVTWGAMILAFSIISFVDSGGIIVGAAFGIVAGALALSRRHQQSPSTKT